MYNIAIITLLNFALLYSWMEREVCGILVNAACLCLPAASWLMLPASVCLPPASMVARMEQVNGSNSGKRFWNEEGGVAVAEGWREAEAGWGRYTYLQ